MSSKYLCTEERFLGDVKNHSMEVLRDDDVSRHLSFTNNGSSCYRFDLITWPGHLCVTGDCGTYVFQRLTDMFQFFRMDDNDFNKRSDRKLNINPHYWGEKLLSVGTNAGYMEFDEEAFRERVEDHFADHMDCEENDPEELNEIWEDIDSLILSETHDEHAAYQAVTDFECNGFQFEDFFDGGGTQCHTFHYIWCLYAIAYGIQIYDASKEQEAA